MKVNIKTIPHAEQRYETCGDWWWAHTAEDHDLILEIRVSRMRNSYFEALIAFHEMIEALLCFKNNVSEADVTKFDLMFETERAQGLHKSEDEPGFDVRAPYRREHNFATMLEMCIGSELGVNWIRYADAITSLSQAPSSPSPKPPPGP